MGVIKTKEEILNACFADNIPATELMLRIILGKADLRVNSVETQKTLKNLFGRSLRLDIKAIDRLKKVYNVEDQRDNSGADPKRARYHGSLLDANVVEPGEQFENINETYVIFITEKDYFEQGKPIYEADRARYFKKDEGGVKKMCKMLEDMRNEEAIRNSKKIALRMIADGKLSIEMIAQYTELPVEEVRKLAGEKSA